jgi:hypothetical protein
MVRIRTEGCHGFTALTVILAKRGTQPAPYRCASERTARHHISEDRQYAEPSATP